MFAFHCCVAATRAVRSAVWPAMTPVTTPAQPAPRKGLADLEVLVRIAEVQNAVFFVFVLCFV